MSNELQVRTFQVDGKPYTEKTFGEDRARAIPHIVATSDGLKERTVFGFTTQDGMESWLKEIALIDDYNRLNDVLRRAQRTLLNQETDPAVPARIPEIQAHAVNEATIRFESALNAYNIQPDQPGQIDKIIDVLQSYDPLEGPIAHSITLWPHCNYGGAPRVFPGGFGVPNFKWVDFNDVASSALHFGAAQVLFSDTWFRGRRIYFYGVIRADCFVDYPWYFNDVASSTAGI